MQQQLAEVLAVVSVSRSGWMVMRGGKSPFNNGVSAAVRTEHFTQTLPEQSSKMLPSSDRSVLMILGSLHFKTRVFLEQQSDIDLCTTAEGRGSILSP